MTGHRRRPGVPPATAPLIDFAVRLAGWPPTGETTAERDKVDTGADDVAGQRILGRDPELSRIARLLDAVHGGGPQVLVLTGEPGAGKSTLVDRAAERGAAKGLRVLRVRGSEGEAGLGLSGLHQLLRPLLPGIDRLPESQRDALRCAFGLLPAGTVPVEPLYLCAGVTSLIADAAAEQPLLLLVDDAQWLDLGSLDVLAFVARRFEGDPVVLLLAAREDSVPVRFDRDFPHLVAGPLERRTAGLLLDTLPEPPRGRARAWILEQAAGNPLALVELARALAKGRGDLGAAPSLPLTNRLERLFAADLPTLPAETRKVLLLVAAAGTAQLADVVAAAPALDVAQALHPAEQAGLVHVEGGQVLLRHPLVRTAVQQAAGFAERREAHLALAAALAHEPDRRAWHLAAAALGQDAEVADALAESAERSRGRGGHAAAAAALERSAELTPDPGQRAVRLIAAARSAMFGGHPQWVGELTARVDGLTADPLVRAEASLLGGWALGVTRRHDEALALMLPVGEAMAAAAPALAIGALGTAATSVYNSGDPFHRTELERIAGLVVAEVSPADRAWIEASTHPHTRRGRVLALLDQAVAALPEDGLAELTTVGGAAWIMDETELAVRLLGGAMDHLRRAGTAGMNATVAQALALAQFERGAWAEALSNAEDAFWMAAEAGADNVTTGAPLLQATVAAFRGDHAAACARAEAAVRGVDLRKSLSLQVRYRYARGVAATVEGDHEGAYEHLRATFTHDAEPGPVHYHASVYHLADLAAAAVRVGRTEDARAVLAATGRTLGADRSARVDAVVRRATALLSDSDEAEHHFLAAVADPAAARWPFEHALAQLDFGEWLRRRRRSAEARPQLGAALEVFRRLDARPWQDRAAAELRAAGASVPQSGVTASPAAGLTPQERQIAELAAQGLTNRDIAARLFLSPRTVGYHLHKIFPKLGIKARAQLRDALSDAAPPRG
ncbi:AAA family ATPase [Kitasatospora sp. NPDC127111]|uniref:helix-turn-helix transcriptional regulator n=1 Tax=Kitasatospora sp. NPDC127111 TaxID=3345363 RepID=UPI00363058F1